LKEEETDATGGKLNYAVFREQSARTGRFLMADPVRGNVRNPQRLNRFVYVTNNPTNYLDPEGRDLIVTVPMIDPIRSLPAGFGEIGERAFGGASSLSPGWGLFEGWGWDGWGGGGFGFGVRDSPFLSPTPDPCEEQRKCIEKAERDRIRCHLATVPAWEALGLMTWACALTGPAALVCFEFVGLTEVLVVSGMNLTCERVYNEAKRDCIFRYACVPARRR
jgi:RHS repeat-associated protein